MEENLKKLYLDSSVFVLPSIHDGFGMVISETNINLFIIIP